MFRVYIRQTVEYDVEVEAASFDEAAKMAEKIGERRFPKAVEALTGERNGTCCDASRKICGVYDERED